MKVRDIAITIMVIIVLLLMISPFFKVIKENGIGEKNHCLENGKVYYRVIGGILSSSVKTTKENSDYNKIECIKWEKERTPYQKLIPLEDS